MYDVLSILLFAVPPLFVQFIFCKFYEKIAVKLIPVYIFVICAVILLLTYFDGKFILAGLLGIILGIAFVGDIVAWGIYLINSKKAKKEGSK